MTRSHLRIFLGFTVALVALNILAVGVSAGETSKKTKSPTPATASSTNQGDTTTKVDLNTASEKDLESLPSVGSATAKKIIAGRPYSSVNDLSKAGISAATIKKIAPLVAVSGAAASAPTKAATTATTKPTATATTTKTAEMNAKVDLNTASEKDLDSLPGVGPATAKKIIAGRPYSSVDNLSKAGISATTIKKIAPLVMVSDGAAATKNATASAPSSQPPSPTPSEPAPASPAKTSAPPAFQGNPGPGMVWVNLDSGVYHYEGSRYYGKTKSGKYISEADAVKAGYHPAKNEKKPQ
jgi:DNA uptake protein ComE-like DNA-binding protein